MRGRMDEGCRINEILSGAFRSARVRIKVGHQLHSAQATNKYYEQGIIAQSGARAARKQDLLFRRRTTGEALSGQIRFGNVLLWARPVRPGGTLRGAA